ncbi:MAG: hypothetical protein ABI683_15815, partial [Ginsengibacter sp.]
RGPSACKADALNQLSYAPIIIVRVKSVLGSANIREEQYSKKFNQKAIFTLLQKQAGKRLL